MPKSVETTHFEVEYEALSILLSSFHLWDGKDLTEKYLVFFVDLLDRF